MTLASDLIQQSFEQLAIYSPGDTLDTNDQNRAFVILNQMMDEWSNWALATYTDVEQSVVLTPGKQQYSIGTSGGADINLTRPLKILEGPGMARIRDVNNIDYDVDVVARDTWNEIVAKQTNSQIPDTLWYDTQFPLGVLNIYPSPLLAYTLFWTSNQQLGQFASLSSAVNFPPGYEAAIVPNLSVRMAPYWKNAKVSDEVKEQARECLASIKRTNIRSEVAEFDAELVTRVNATYNIFRGSSR